MSETKTPRADALRDRRFLPCDRCGGRDEDGMNWVIPKNTRETNDQHAVVCSACFLGPAKEKQK